MASDGSTSILRSWHSCSMAIEHQHGLKWVTRSHVTAWHLVATCATDINSDLGFSRAKDTDIALSCCSGPDVTMAPSGSTGHSDVMASVAALPLNTNRATGGGTDTGHA